MTNDLLTRLAQELQDDLRPKVGCYCVVGWQKSSSGAVLTVYIDERKSVSPKLIPRVWFGLAVHVHEVLPPGIKPVDIDIDLDGLTLP